MLVIIPPPPFIEKAASQKNLQKIQRLGSFDQPRPPVEIE